MNIHQIKNALVISSLISDGVERNFQTRLLNSTLKNLVKVLEELEDWNVQPGVQVSTIHVEGAFQVATF